MDTNVQHQPDPHQRPAPQRPLIRPGDDGEAFFDKEGVKAVCFREANVVVLYIDGGECGWWNATYWNQAEIGILVAPNLIRLQQGTFPIVDFNRKIEVEPVGNEMFPTTL